MGKVNEVKSDAAEAERLDNLIYEMLDTNTKNKRGYFKSEVHKRSHADWYITATEAIKMKLATKIGVPNFYVDVDVKYYIL